MISINKNYEISKKSYIHIGGIVKEYVECDNLYQSINYLKEKKFIALGNTSKILFAFDRSDISFFKFVNRKVVFFDNCFFAYSGISLNYLNYLLTKRGITGFEFLSTIPGNLGGSIVNNSSFLNQCISDLLIKILVYDKGKLFFIDKKDISFAYRSSGLIKNNYLIVGAFFEINKDNFLNIKRKNEVAIKYRKEHQEISRFTLGSTFKNINDIKMGYILDCLGYRGYKYSDSCAVSDRHANFIIVKPFTNYIEIYNLINFLKKMLYNYLHKEIDEEIQIIFSNGERNK